MARRSIWFLPEHYYHIYNRGNNKEPIFLSDDNYHFFLRRLHHYYDQAAVQLIAYCLMPNHYHLLIYIHKEIDFSNVMRAFTISYTRSFNNWHRRVGHLFQSDFQARGIERDGYLPHLCRYIHLNPVKSMLVKNPEDWEYSDYRDWISIKQPTTRIEQSAREMGYLLTFSKYELRDELFGSAHEYKIFVMDFAEEQRLQKKIEKYLFG